MTPSKSNQVDFKNESREHKESGSSRYGDRKTLFFRMIIKDFLNFIRNPKDVQYRFSFLERLKFLGGIFVFEVILNFAVIFPLLAFLDQFLLIRERDYREDFLTLSKTFFVIVLILPFFEEVVCRLILRRKGIVKRIISQKKWDKAFPFLVYFFSVIFGFLHLFNYEPGGVLFYALSMAIVLSQLVGGFILSFIRVRLNFFWGYGYHAFWNFFFAILFPVAFYALEKPFYEEGANFTLSIKEHFFYKQDSPYTLNIEREGDTITAIAAEQFYFQDLLDSLSNGGEYKFQWYLMNDEIYVDMNFTSDEGMTFEEVIELFKKKYKIADQSQEVFGSIDD